MSNRPKESAELDVLAAIAQGDAVTQMSLKSRIGVSVGLVNALIKRAVKKGHVKISQAPYRRYVYYLTPQGFQEKSRLISEYLKTSVQFFRQAKTEYAAVFAAARDLGLERLALVGNSELAEIATLAAVEEDVRLVLFDAQANQPKQYGLDIIRDLSDGGVDAFVITDVEDPQATFECLSRTFPGMRILMPPLLRISALQKARDADNRKAVES